MNNTNNTMDVYYPATDKMTKEEIIELGGSVLATMSIELEDCGFTKEQVDNLVTMMLFTAVHRDSLVTYWQSQREDFEKYIKERTGQLSEDDADD